MSFYRVHLNSLDFSFAIPSQFDVQILQTNKIKYTVSYILLLIAYDDDCVQAGDGARVLKL